MVKPICVQMFDWWMAYPDVSGRIYLTEFPLTWVCLDSVDTSGKKNVFSLHKTHVESEAKNDLQLLNHMERFYCAKQIQFITRSSSTASSVVSSVFSVSGSPLNHQDCCYSDSGIRAAGLRCVSGLCWTCFKCPWPIEVGIGALPGASLCHVWFPKHHTLFIFQFKFDQISSLLSCVCSSCVTTQTEMSESREPAESLD